MKRLVATTLLLVTCAGCARLGRRDAHPVAAAPAQPHSPLLGERRALGSIESASDGPARFERLRRIAELELRLGDSDAADEAARELVEAAGMEAALAEAMGATPAEVAAAKARLLDAVDYIASLARRSGNAHALLASIGWVPDQLPRWKSALRAGALGREPAGSDGDFQPGDLSSRLTALFAGDIEALAAMEYAGWIEPAQEVSAETLRRFGGGGAKLLDRRFMQAAGAGDHKAARALVAVMLGADPLHLPARLTELLLDGGPAEKAAWGASGMGVWWSGLSCGGMASLVKQARDQPDSAPIALALGWCELRSGLLGDARRLAAQVEQRTGVAAPVRAAARELRALADFEAGDMTALRALRSGGDALPRGTAAWWLEERELRRFGRGAKQPGAVQRAALLRDRLERDEPAWSTGLAEARDVVLDPQAAAPVRARARRLLAANDPHTERTMASCDLDGVGAGPCRERVDLVTALEGDGEDQLPDDSSKVPAILGARIEPRRTWFRRLQWRRMQQVQSIDPWIAAQGGRPAAVTDEYVTLRARMALAARDPARLRRLVDLDGNLLSTPHRLALELLLRDRARWAEAGPAGRPPDGGAREAAHQPDGGASAAGSARTTGDDDTESEDEEGGRDVGGDSLPAYDLPHLWMVKPGRATPGTTVPGADQEPDAKQGSLGELRHATGLLRTGRAQAALRELRPLLDRTDGLGKAELAELAGWIHLAAYEAGDAATRSTAHRLVMAAAPASDVAALVEGREAMARGDGTAALAAFSTALRLRPHSDAAGQGLAEALVLVDAAHAPERFTRLMARLSPELKRAHRGTSDSLEVGSQATVNEWRRALGTTLDPARAFELGPAHVPDGQRFRVRSWIVRQLGTLAPDRLVDFAARASTWLAADRTHGARRSLIAWSQLIAGDPEAARRTATAPELPGPRAATPRPGARGTWFERDEGPLTEDAPLLLVIRAAPRAAPSRLQALFLQFHEGAGYAVTADQRTPATRILLEQAETAPPALAALWRELACHAIQDAARATQGIDACFHAWRAGRRSPTVAVQLSWAMLNNIAAAEAAGVVPEKFFTEARAALAGNLPVALLHNQALWLSRKERHREAAAVEEEAWLAGEAQRSEGLIKEDLPRTRLHPLLSRWLAASGRGADRDLSIASSAFVAGDLEIAALHLRAAQARDLDQLARPRREWLETLRDLLELAHADRAEGSSQEDVGAWAEAILDGNALERTDELAAAHRAGTIGDVLRCERDHGHPAARARSLVALRSLAARFPANATIALDLMRLLLAGNGEAEARTVIAAVRKRRPDDVRLAAITLRDPAAPGTPAPPPPEALRSPEAWARALAPDPKVDAPLERQSQLRVHPGQPIEAVVPSSYQSEGGDFTWVHDGVRIGVRLVPRDSHCEPRTCLDQFVTGMERSGGKRGWSRNVTLPAGEGAEAVVILPMAQFVVDAVPLGSQVFFVFVGGPPEQLVAALPAIRLVRDTFRPRDAVMGPRQAAALRKLPGWMTAARVQARRALFSTGALGKGCPIGAALATASEPERKAQLLADTFLVTPQPTLRRRLLECAPVASAEAADLAVAALWDDDEAIHEFGRRAVAAHPAAALAQGRAVLPFFDESAPSVESDGRAPERYGLLQLMSALPPSERPALAGEMLTSGTPKLRALALAAPLVAEGAVSEEQLRRPLQAGSTREALLAVIALPAVLEPATIAVLRRRMASLKAPLGRAERELAVQGAHNLAAQLDRADGPLLGRIADAVRASEKRRGKKRGGGQARHIDETQRAHRLAVARGPIAGHDSAAAMAEHFRAARQAAASAAHDAGGPAPARLTALSTRPLPELLRGAGWSYYKIPRPGLFGASMASLLSRLRGSDAGLFAMARTMLTAMARERVGAVLDDSGGVDLTRPLECANSAGGGHEYVCSAFLRDPAAVARIVGKGDEMMAPAALPYFAGNVAMVLPIGGVVLPFLIDAAVESEHDREPPDEDEEREEPPSPLLHERARDRVTIAGLGVDRRLSLSADTDGDVNLSAELHLLLGDRLLVFSSERLARKVLESAPEPSATFAAAPGFRAATAAWADGAALQVVGIGDANPMGSGLASVEAVASAEGLEMRMHLPFTGALHDARPLYDALPPGSVARLAFGGDGRPGRSDLEPPAHGEGRPPAWLVASGSSLAFGWYPEAGHAVWHRWAAIFEWLPAARDRWLAHHLPEPPETPATATGEDMIFTRKGDLVIVGSDAKMVESALARAAAAPAAAGDGRRPAPLVGAGELDGLKAAEWIDNLATGKRGGRQPGMLRAAAAVVSVARRVSLEARVEGEPAGLVVEARVLPEIAPRGEERGVVDEWLSTRRLQNALRLPRELTTEEAAHALIYVVESADAAHASRTFPGSARLAATTISAGRIELRVKPGPALEAAVEPSPISADDRRSFTSPEGGGAFLDAIRATSAELAPRGTAPTRAARAIVEWVHRTLKYELTPSVITDREVLDRRRGDCTEYSQITVSLLRAAGIPARVRSSFAAGGEEVVAHAWVEFHDGTGWREVDPTAGRLAVTAAYVDASVVDVLALLSLGKIRIVEVK